MNHQDLIQASQEQWQQYTHHPFVEQIANGQLAQESFLHYLQQDFLFLKQYVRARALTLFKSQSIAEMQRIIAPLTDLVQSELAHHLAYCQQWGIDGKQMEDAVEEVGTIAAARYLIDIACSGDSTDLYVALAPCPIGYAHIGQYCAHIGQDLAKNQPVCANPYQSWLDLYAGRPVQQAAANTKQALDALLSDIALSSRKGQRLIEIFSTVTRLETVIWQQSMSLPTQHLSAQKRSTSLANSNMPTQSNPLAPIACTQHKEETDVNA